MRPRFLLQHRQDVFWFIQLLRSCYKSKCQSDQGTVLRGLLHHVSLCGPIQESLSPTSVSKEFTCLLPSLLHEINHFESCRADQLYSYLVLQRELKFSLPSVGLGVRPKGGFGGYHSFPYLRLASRKPDLIFRSLSLWFPFY